MDNPISKALDYIKAGFPDVVNTLEKVGEKIYDYTHLIEEPFSKRQEKLEVEQYRKRYRALELPEVLKNNIETFLPITDDQQYGMYITVPKDITKDKLPAYISENIPETTKYIIQEYKKMAQYCKENKIDFSEVNDRLIQTLNLKRSPYNIDGNIYYPSDTITGEYTKRVSEYLKNEELKNKIIKYSKLPIEATEQFFRTFVLMEWLPAMGLALGNIPYSLMRKYSNMDVDGKTIIDYYKKGQELYDASNYSLIFNKEYENPELIEKMPWNIVFHAGGVAGEKVGSLADELFKKFNIDTQGAGELVGGELGTFIVGGKLFHLGTSLGKYAYTRIKYRDIFDRLNNDIQTDQNKRELIKNMMDNIINRHMPEEILNERALLNTNLKRLLSEEKITEDKEKTIKQYQKRLDEIDKALFNKAFNILAVNIYNSRNIDKELLKETYKQVSNVFDKEFQTKDITSLIDTEINNLDKKLLKLDIFPNREDVVLKRKELENNKEILLDIKKKLTEIDSSNNPYDYFFSKFYKKEETKPKKERRKTLEKVVPEKEDKETLKRYFVIKDEKNTLTIVPETILSKYENLVDRYRNNMLVVDDRMLPLLKTRKILIEDGDKKKIINGFILPANLREKVPNYFEYSLEKLKDKYKGKVPSSEIEKLKKTLKDDEIERLENIIKSRKQEKEKESEEREIKDISTSEVATTTDKTISDKTIPEEDITEIVTTESEPQITQQTTDKTQKEKPAKESKAPTIIIPTSQSTKEEKSTKTTKDKTTEQGKSTEGKSKYNKSLNIQKMSLQDVSKIDITKIDNSKLKEIMKRYDEYIMKKIDELQLYEEDSKEYQTIEKQLDKVTKLHNKIADEIKSRKEESQKGSISLFGKKKEEKKPEKITKSPEEAAKEALTEEAKAYKEKISKRKMDITLEDLTNYIDRLIEIKKIQLKDVNREYNLKALKDEITENEMKQYDEKIDKIKKELSQYNKVIDALKEKFNEIRNTKVGSKEYYAAFEKVYDLRDKIMKDLDIKVEDIKKISPYKKTKETYKTEFSTAKQLEDITEDIKQRKKQVFKEINEIKDIYEAINISRPELLRTSRIPIKMELGKINKQWEDYFTKVDNLEKTLSKLDKKSADYKNNYLKYIELYNKYNKMHYETQKTIENIIKKYGLKEKYDKIKN